jgi:hypothetical protein
MMRQEARRLVASGEGSDRLAELHGDPDGWRRRRHNLFDYYLLAGEAEASKNGHQSRS